MNIFSGEFINRTVTALLKKRGIAHIFASNHVSPAENVIRQLKLIIHRLFETNFAGLKKREYISRLSAIENSWNSTVHKKIAPFSPISISQSNSAEVFKKLYPEIVSGRRRYPLKFRFQLGARVRVSVAKAPLVHTYYQTFSKETFKIVGRIASDPVQYKLAYWNEEEEGGKSVQYSGTYYEEQLIPYH